MGFGGHKKDMGSDNKHFGVSQFSRPGIGLPSGACSRHDQYQVETVFTYPFDDFESGKEYYVDAYFFLPDSLGINTDSYGRDDFYRDCRRYTRLKTPSLRLDKVLHGADAPLVKLRLAVEKLSENREDAECRKEYSDRLKMFCSIMKSSLRDEAAFLSRALQTDNFADLLQRKLKEEREILTVFRDLRRLFSLDGAVGGEAYDGALFRYADEFLSLTAVKYNCRIWRVIKSAPPENGVELLKILYRQTRREEEYREQRHYPSVAESHGDNEELLHREGVLKKLMSSVLFLRSSRRREGVLLENLLFGMAAGVAMIFATGLAFAWRNIYLEEFSTAFFILLVVSYMLKDRLKDILRYYLQRELRRFIYDYKTEIRSALGSRVGICRESFSFIHARNVDQEVLSLRQRTELESVCNANYEEQIILARKRFTLSPPVGDRLFNDFAISGIVDIIRFNIRHFLEKMDNPQKLMPLLDNGTVRWIKGRRVYHINVILKYGVTDGASRCRRLRLVLTRNGIRRIENIG